MKKYKASDIEKKWQKIWIAQQPFVAKNSSKKPKFYVLDMFPYPSGEGLHVGHVEGYTASDIIARFKRMRGFNVLHPMGWDAFGLPAENYAIKKKVHPATVVKRNIARFKKQLNSIGFGYDWSREINTTDPEYYKWTQWIFLQLYNKGLAYEAEAPINWCPSCKTGLANEEVVNGACDRCGATVEKRNIRQWILKITEYAERLLADLEELEWPEKVKLMQQHWIGRSEGTLMEFKIKDSKFKIEVYTTRVDTIYGCTYCVVAPEHPLIENVKIKIKNVSEVDAYIENAKRKSDLQRTDLEKNKTGVQLDGVMALNPFTNEYVPVFVADYVLGHYGTGAVMAVPAHDTRDFAFAKKYGLLIKNVVVPLAAVSDPSECFVDDGRLIESGDFIGMTSNDARKKMTAWLSEKGLGGKKVNYKLRDWVFSRQRYWGEPIPLIKCPKCGTLPVPEKDLPVKLPNVKNYEPTGTGESPLAAIESWVNTKCPKCNGSAKRETNTMPQWAGSCWYYLRYLDPKNKKTSVSKNAESYWMQGGGVDLYIGGVEHAVLHLLYARFWHKVLFDIGAVSTKEPFKKLINQGLILGPDNQKMSKSKGNVISPDDVVKQYGADTLRMYEMFMGPLADTKPWDTKGIIGVYRFLSRIYQLGQKIAGQKTVSAKNNISLEKAMHKTIKKVTADMDAFAFNTAISSMMIYLHELEGVPSEVYSKNMRRYFETLLLLVSPMAPHLAEELWQTIGHKKSIMFEKWPAHNEALTVDDEIEYVVQINGKLRDTIRVQRDAAEQECIAKALDSDKIKGYIASAQIKKTIFVKGRLLNIVI